MKWLLIIYVFSGSLTIQQFDSRETCLKVLDVTKELCESQYGDCMRTQGARCIEIDLVPKIQNIENW